MTDGSEGDNALTRLDELFSELHSLGMSYDWSANGIWNYTARTELKAFFKTIHSNIAAYFGKTYKYVEMATLVETSDAIQSITSRL